ncbi:MAG: iron-containing alcohol dehydrogenase, partial [Atribacterota bacterium]
MQGIKDCQIQDLLNKDIKCSCGRTHRADIEDIIISKGAIDTLPDLLVKYQCKKNFLVADNNTYDAAGEKVERLLKEKGFDLATHVFKREGQLVPNENSVSEFLIHAYKDADIIIAIGTGTLNDLAKFVSYKLNIPYIIVATAPSMDGFSSVGAALIVDN